jgi:tRNA(Ile)-lysidine synthase
VIRSVDARNAKGESPEETARNCRYEAFAAILEPEDVLLLAQHQDDQAETFLLQLFRGAGPKGLSAMPLRTSFHEGHLLRPFLGVSREDIVKVGSTLGIPWIEDLSNQNTRYDRNLIRRDILPLIQQRWPAVVSVIARSAQHVATSEQLLEESIDDRYQSILDGACLKIDRLKRLAPSMQRAIVRRWIRSQGFRLPSTKIIERICSEALHAAPDRNPDIVWPEGRIRRYRGQLSLHPHLPAIPKLSPHSIPSTIKLIPLEENGCLVLEETFGEGIALADWNTHTINVHYRRGGEKIKLKGRQGHQELRKLFQEEGVPPWERNTIPLIYLNDKLAAVGDLWIDESFSAESKSSTGIKIEHRKP